MNILNQTKYDNWKKNQGGKYGLAVFRYAEQWANLMEEKIINGEKLENIANQSSHDADTEGISGYMYGAAVFVLSECWEYGEQLRRWSNLDLQIGNEGEKANDEGGTLNPALLNISRI